jgi:hypothetical protein
VVFSASGVSTGRLPVFMAGPSPSTYTLDNMLMTEACPRDRGLGACD